MAVNVSKSPLVAVGSKVLLVSVQARFGTDTDMGFVTTTGQAPVVFWDDELASLSRGHSFEPTKQHFTIKFSTFFTYENLRIRVSSCFGKQNSRDSKS